jgi:hypothetical protein
MPPNRPRVYLAGSDIFRLDTAEHLMPSAY